MTEKSEEILLKDGNVKKASCWNMEIGSGKKPELLLNNTEIGKDE